MIKLTIKLQLTTAFRHQQGLVEIAKPSISYSIAKLFVIANELIFWPLSVNLWIIYELSKRATSKKLGALGIKRKCQMPNPGLNIK